MRREGGGMLQRGAARGSRCFGGRDFQRVGAVPVVSDYSHHIEDYQPPPRELSEQQEQLLSSSESESDLEEGHDQELPHWKHNIISIVMPSLLNNVPNPWSVLLCLGFLHILVLGGCMLLFTRLCPIEFRCFLPTTYHHWYKI